MALTGTEFPIFAGRYTGSLVAPPATTLTGTGSQSMIVQVGPGASAALPLQLTSVSAKDNSPLFGNQRALLGMLRPKNATFLKMHKDRSVLLRETLTHSLNPSHTSRSLFPSPLLSSRSHVASSHGSERTTVAATNHC